MSPPFITRVQEINREFGKSRVFREISANQRNRVLIGPRVGVRGLHLSWATRLCVLAQQLIAVRSGERNKIVPAASGNQLLGKHAQTRGPR